MVRYRIAKWGLGLLTTAGLFATTARVNATAIMLSPEGEAGRSRSEYYNLRISELKLAFAGEASATYRWVDNVGYSDDDGEDAGSAIIPRLTLSAYWPVSPYVELSSSVSMGYEYYVTGDGEDQFFLSGDEGQFAADITGHIVLDQDSRIRVRDMWAREVDTLDIAVEDRENDYAAWVHTFDALYSKALNPDLTGKAMYTHEDRWVNKSRYEYLDYTSDAIDLLALYQLMPDLQIGPYARAEYTRFREDIRNDRWLYEFGLSTVGDFRIGERVSYSASVGYQISDIDTSNDPTATDDDGGFTTSFRFAVQPTLFPGHRVRLSYTRNHTDPDPGVNYSDQFLVGYGIDFLIVEDLIASADLDWMDIRDSDDGEHANLWRFILRSSYRLTPKVSISGRYQFLSKTSDVAGNEYDQNLVEVTVSYHF